MTSNETPKTFHEISPTGPRASFEDPRLGRHDAIYQEGPFRRRVLTYPVVAPLPEYLSEIRHTAVEQELILGGQIGDRDPRVNAFVVPTSARPITHEAASESESTYSYNDTSLFNDLGRILGRLAALGSEHPLVLEGKVGENVALVEFTRPGDPKLYLVPGFEYLLNALEDDDSVLSSYKPRLEEEFGQRFERHVDHFTEGFQGSIG